MSSKLQLNFLRPFRQTKYLVIHYVRDNGRNTRTILPYTYHRSLNRDKNYYSNGLASSVFYNLKIYNTQSLLRMIVNDNIVAKKIFRHKMLLNRIECEIKIPVKLCAYKQFNVLQLTELKCGTIFFKSSVILSKSRTYPMSFCQISRSS